MPSMSASINASGGIQSGPAAFLFSVFCFCFTLWYSSIINGPDGMSRMSKMILISSSGWVMIGSFPDKFLKCSCHLLRRSCLLFPLMMPLFYIFCPVRLLISCQINLCWFVWWTNSTFCSMSVISSCCTLLYLSCKNRFCSSSNS